MYYKIAYIVIALSFITGCSDPNAANESNFRQAISEFYITKKACFTVNHEFPINIVSNPILTKTIDYMYSGDDEAMLTELVNEGFLSIEKTEAVPQMFGFTKPRPALKYSLTQHGEEVAKVIGGHGTDFCYGNYVLLEITNFTEPSDVMGNKVTRVKYTYQADGIEDWAKSEPLINRFGVLSRDINSDKEPINGKADLVLTNNGWVHQTIFNQ